MTNSSQLLILGNGFDLHCGLKSSYKDFFRGAILDSYAERFGLQQNQAGVFGFWEGLLLEYYKENNKTDYKWCDIEKIIKDTIIRILYGKPNSYEIGLWYSAVDHITSQGDVKEFLSEKDNKAIYLLKYCMHFYKYLVACGKDACEEALHLLLEQLLQELNNFEKRFCKFIKDKIVNPENGIELNTKYIVNAVNLLAKLTGFSNVTYNDLEDIIDSDMDEHFGYEQTPSNTIDLVVKDKKHLTKDFSNLKSTNILNFNYTALFDILGVKSPCVYSNVHGKLCNANCSARCSNSSVIFGIDDAVIQSQYSNSELRMFSKTYRKMLDPSAPISILPPNDNTPLEIKFYGHSLSEADYSYFQSIFDYYDLYGNNNVSLIFYYSKGFEQNDEIYRLINSYGRTLMNQEQGKNLIHKLLLENRLKIVEVD